MFPLPLEWDFSFSAPIQHINLVFSVLCISWNSYWCHLTILFLSLLQSPHLAFKFRQSVVFLIPSVVETFHRSALQVRSVSIWLSKNKNKNYPPKPMSLPTWKGPRMVEGDRGLSFPSMSVKGGWRHRDLGGDYASNKHNWPQTRIPCCVALRNLNVTIEQETPKPGFSTGNYECWMEESVNH